MEKNHTMAFAAALAYYFVLALFPFLNLALLDRLLGLDRGPNSMQRICRKPGKARP
jgi:hypothetical protein